MWAGAGMSEKRADFIRGFRGKNVFELAGLLFNFGLAVQSQAVGEKTLRQSMTANDVGGALPSAWRQFDNHAAIAD